MHNKGIVELCADDIAIVFQSWFDFPLVQDIFALARKVAGLSLKPRKCILVPLSAPLSPHLIEVLRDFMRSSVPEWAEFNIAASAEYLGIWLGPGASTKYWISQLDKFFHRLHLIHEAGVAQSLAVKAYNLKTVTTISYPAQVLPPPPNIHKIEKYAFCKLYKIPYNSVSHSEQFSFSEFGLDRMTSIDAMCTAIQTRFYYATSELINQCNVQLFNSTDGLTLAELPNSARAFWNNSSLVHNIIRGARGCNLHEPALD
eukprot:11214995-Karenia_brevis.AAC.1